MFSVIIVLENHGIFADSIIFHSIHEVLPQYFAVYVGVHAAFYLAAVAYSFICDAAPHHERATTISALED
jgi:hypothetical protein